MPYSRLPELPDSVTNVLPKHGQEIYKEAFNNAWEEYANPKDLRGNQSREAVSHKVAWAAVKQKYHKNDKDEWVRDQD
ncbi:MAG: ChaB family protein [Pseudomonadota bacterium]|nr:ChaB family protein [Pseudomonadota bacterium]